MIQVQAKLTLDEAILKTQAMALSAFLQISGKDDAASSASGSSRDAAASIAANGTGSAAASNAAARKKSTSALEKLQKLKFHRFVRARVEAAAEKETMLKDALPKKMPKLRRTHPRAKKQSKALPSDWPAAKSKAKAQPKQNVSWKKKKIGGVRRVANKIKRLAALGTPEAANTLFTERFMRCGNSKKRKKRKQAINELMKDFEEL
jgi:hypothetical protein